MAPLIAFVTRTPPEADALQKLRAAMPAETILPMRDIADGDFASVDIAIVANPDPADLARLPNLKWIHSTWAGVERLVSELKDSPLPIVRLVDPQLSFNMAEAVLAWTYYLFRDVPAYARLQRERNWHPLGYRRADQTTVSLLGLGALGTAATSRLKEAGFQVAGWSRLPKQLEGVETFSGEDGLMAILAKTDILVCLLPLTHETTGMLAARHFAALPKGAEFINFARGKIIVTADLVAALDSGHLKHAVLDVFETEPLPVEDALWRNPGITILPHISGPTDPDTAAGIVAANIAAYRRTGVLPATVDRTRGY